MSTTPDSVSAGEQASRKVAEQSRQTDWQHPSFMRELFLGNFRLDLLHPFPYPDAERPEFATYLESMRRFLREEVNSIEIDETGEYPEQVLDGLRRLGAFGMKIPKKYGGLGFTMSEYARTLELIGSVDANLSALLSAHQSIGVPEPIKSFGTEEQKQRFLPRCAKGEISAFALTEPDVGSDPANVSTTAVLSGDHYVLNGVKLWCTNGTLARLLVVMARDPFNKKISAFVVEADTPGVKVERRCHFMGLHALANAVLSFTDVRVPKENLIGEEGRGLKIALTTLNTGRLSIPAASVGCAKACLGISRQWSSEREQWGRPIGKHEAIAHKLARMASTVFAMESMTTLACSMADRGGYDIRLEAAAAKEWCSCRTWEIVDETIQIRGGRGYETARSLMNRGEKPIPVEQIFRDYRINKIFEGSSEIMHLFMAREAVDKHLQVAGDMIDPEKSGADKARAFFRAVGFYSWWYPSRWLGWGHWPRYSEFGKLAGHLRFVERTARKLARQVFHGMGIYQAKLQVKQAFLFRLVDIANELFAMAATVARAQAYVHAGSAHKERACELADLFCRHTRHKIHTLFYELWHNDDAAQYKLGVGVTDSSQRWLEGGTLPLAEQTSRCFADAQKEGANMETKPKTGEADSARWDKIDEASWESFPASDPPAHSHEPYHFTPPVKPTPDPDKTADSYKPVSH